MLADTVPAGHTSAPNHTLPMTLLARLRQRGFTLSAGEDGQLMVGPRDKITDDDAHLIRKHKAALLAQLAAEAKPKATERPILVHPEVLSQDDVNRLIMALLIDD